VENVTAEDRRLQRGLETGDAPRVEPLEIGDAIGAGARDDGVERRGSSPGASTRSFPIRACGTSFSAQ
jgi:hypothetical protein